MFKVNKLKNGLTLLLLKRKTMRSASVSFCVKSGSVHEEDNIAGVSHFIEHTVFRKTKTRNIKEIKKPLEEVGGSLNAFTARNLTLFYSKVPSRNINIAIEILSDLTFNASLEKDDIEKEKKVILEEIAMYEDDPVDQIFENLFRNVYDSNFGRPIIGYRETVKNMDENILRTHYKKNFIPENTIVSIVGNFDEVEVIRYLESLEINRESKEKNEIKSPKISNEEISVKKTKKDLSQNYLVYAYKAPPKYSKDYYATLVLNTLMGSGMSSLLFTNIREEEGLVYEVASDYNSYNDSGLFMIFAATSNENIENYKEKIEEITKLIYKREDLNDWVNYGKQRLIGKLTIDIETNMAYGMKILDLYLTYGKIVNIDEIVKRVEKVTLEDVIKVSKEIFTNTRFISELNPEK
ncbi:MAG: M16 family metallopeptidase [Thermotogota bacterium]